MDLIHYPSGRSLLCLTCTCAEHITVQPGVLFGHETAWQKFSSCKDSFLLLYTEDFSRGMKTPKDTNHLPCLVSKEAAPPSASCKLSLSTAELLGHWVLLQREGYAGQQRCQQLRGKSADSRPTSFLTCIVYSRCSQSYAEVRIFLKNRSAD